MLKTNGDPTQEILGIDQQDFAQIQFLVNAFPHRVGAQRRIPGKSLIQKVDDPIYGIHTFYLVYGRRYNLIDFGNDLQIEEIENPVVVLPVLPPTQNTWFDSFSTYTVGLISRFWGEGNWANAVGICESIIYGVIDPFLVSDTIVSENQRDILPYDVEEDDTNPISEDTSIRFYFPNGAAQIMLRRIKYHPDYSCIGGGVGDVDTDDILKIYAYPGDPSPDIVGPLDIAINGTIPVGNIRVGRPPNEDVGVVNSLICPNPPSIFPNEPTMIVYYYNLNNGEYGQES